MEQSPQHLKKEAFGYGIFFGALTFLNNANAIRLAARAPKPVSVHSGTTKNPPVPPGVMSA
jgi:hypothetical protein